MKTHLTAGLGGWLFLAAGVTGVDAGKPAPLVRGPYLQRGTPHSMVVVWRTRGMTDPVLRYGPAPDRLDHAAGGEAIRLYQAPGRPFSRLPRLHSAPKDIVQYEALVAGLGPATRYYYGVFDGKRLLSGADADHFFTTSPEPGTSRPLSFVVMGDSGTGLAPAKSVHGALLMHGRQRGFVPDLFLHVGDMAYTHGRDREFQSNFFDVYQPTLARTPLWPAIGNHEEFMSNTHTGRGPYFDAFVLPAKGEAGGVPSGTEAYYSFDYGNVHFVSLCTGSQNRRPGGAMAKWLRKDLAATEAGWLIAFFHHSPYSKGSHDSDREQNLVEVRRYLMPILEGAGVDVVLSGHSHIYERSKLMNGAYATPTVAEGVILDAGDGDPAGDGAYRKPAGLHPHAGTVQVVTGHGGQLMHRMGTMPVMHTAIEEYGCFCVEIDGDTLSGFMLNHEGVVRDRFSIVKDR